MALSDPPGTCRLLIFTLAIVKAGVDLEMNQIQSNFHDHRAHCLHKFAASRVSMFPGLLGYLGRIQSPEKATSGHSHLCSVYFYGGQKFLILYSSLFISFYWMLGSQLKVSFPLATLF